MTPDNFDCMTDVHTSSLLLFTRNFMFCRRGGHPTDWLTLLPQTTLIDVMQRRCRLIAGRWNCTWSPTDAEILKVEGSIAA
jgi:hypothetical protein